jgi:uncharacterized protein YhfF
MAPSYEFSLRAGFLSHVSERALSGLSTVDGDGAHSVRQFQKEAKAFFRKRQRKPSVPAFSLVMK